VVLKLGGVKGLQGRSEHGMLLESRITAIVVLRFAFDLEAPTTMTNAAEKGGATEKVQEPLR